jgi:hypothetical protein
VLLLLLLLLLLLRDESALAARQPAAQAGEHAVWFPMVHIQDLLPVVLAQAGFGCVLILCWTPTRCYAAKVLRRVLA